MKNLAMAFALLAVLGLVGVSLAETTYLPTTVVAGDPAMHLVVSDPVALNYGLVKYTVTAYSDVNAINVVSALTIAGDVHQVWPLLDDETMEYGTTIFPSDLAGATWRASWNDYDTHRLCEGSQNYVDLHGTYVGPVETNAGGASYSGDFVKLYQAKVGFGTLTAGDGSSDSFTGSGALNAMPIVQIVIPEMTQVLLTVRTVDVKQNSGMYVDIPVGTVIPEPSTIVMLVLGGLCLVGYRLRKK